MNARHTLSAWLRARSDEELAALFADRPDLAQPVPSDMVGLATRATTHASVWRALEQLDRPGLAVCEVLAVRGGSAPLPDLVEQLGDDLGGPTGAEAALQGPRRLALVWGDDVVHLVGPARGSLSWPGGLGPPVEEALLRYSYGEQLEVVARALDLPGGHRDEIAAGVRDLFSDPRRLEALLAGLPPGQRGLLDWLAWESVVSVTGDAQRPVPLDQAEEAWQALTARALLVPMDDQHLLVPREVGLALRGGRLFRPGALRPPAPAYDEVGAARVDQAAAGQALAAVRAVGELLELWGQQPAGVLRAGGVGVRELRRAARHLGLAEHATATHIELGYAAGLLGQTHELAAVWLPTPAYDDWCRLEPARQWRALADAWLGMAAAPGLVGSRDEQDKVVAALSIAASRHSMPALRARILALLAELPPGTAPDREWLLAALRFRAPLRAGEAASAVVTTTLDEAELLGLTGAGALSGPGRLAAAGDLDAAAQALAALLPPPVDHVLVQADLTAVAPGPLVPELAADLHAVADVESKGGATVYRFTEASVRRALDAGRTPAELHQLLDRHSRTPVPQPLHYLIDDVARRHGRVRVGTMQSYVRSEDPAVLQEVLAARRSEPLGLRLVAPTVLVSSASADQVLEVLRGLGHAPVAESAQGAIVVERTKSRRTPRRPAPARPRQSQPLAPELLASAVRALRAGDRVFEAAPQLQRPKNPSHALRLLQDAANHGREVWIAYLNAEGEVSQRLIQPRMVNGAQVLAYDHRSGELRRFTVHRITGVADVE